MAFCVLYSNPKDLEACALTGDQLFDLRHRLGLTRSALGRRLGYAGNDATLKRMIRRAEGRRGEQVEERLATRIDILLAKEHRDDLQGLAAGLVQGPDH